MPDKNRTTTEYAVATRTFIDGPLDRLDTGEQWSSRRGRGYTREEALALVARENENLRRRADVDDPNAVVAVLFTREVTEWGPAE